MADLAQLDLETEGTSSQRNAGVIEEALAGAETQEIEAPVTQGDPTAISLRAELGDAAEGLTDAELLAEWKKAQEPEAPVELDVPMYDEQGNKITDASKVTLADLLSGKIKVAYNAMGKEQRKTFKEALRTASNGHYNEQKYNTAIAEREQLRTKYQPMETEHKTWAEDRAVWNTVLTAAVNGNIEPLQKLIDAFAAEAKNLPAETETAAPGYDAETERAGQDFVLNTILPTVYDLAKKHGYDDPIDIRNTAIAMMQAEGDFLTKEKVDLILQHELPRMLEEKGYKATGALPQADGDNSPLATENAALKKQLQELTATKANTRMAALRAKAKKAPPAGAGHTQNAGEVIPAEALKSRHSYKQWLHGEE